MTQERSIPVSGEVTARVDFRCYSAYSADNICNYARFGQFGRPICEIVCKVREDELNG